MTLEFLGNASQVRLYNEGQHVLGRLFTDPNQNIVLGLITAFPDSEPPLARVLRIIPGSPVEYAGECNSSAYAESLVVKDFIAEKFVRKALEATLVKKPRKR